MQGRQAITVLDEVLFPTDQIHIPQEHLDLTSDQKALEGRIVDINVGDIDFVDFICMRFDPSQRGFHVFQLPMHGECK